MLLDKVRSTLGGMQHTEAQDAWFKNVVEPIQEGGKMYDEDPNADFVDKAFYGLGRTAMMIDQAIASGGEAGGAVAAGGGALERAAGGAASCRRPGMQEPRARPGSCPT